METIASSPVESHEYCGLWGICAMDPSEDNGTFDTVDHDILLHRLDGMYLI